MFSFYISLEGKALPSLHRKSLEFDALCLVLKYSTLIHPNHDLPDLLDWCSIILDMFIRLFGIVILSSGLVVDSRNFNNEVCNSFDMLKLYIIKKS